MDGGLQQRTALGQTGQLVVRPDRDGIPFRHRHQRQRFHHALCPPAGLRQPERFYRDRRAVAQSLGGAAADQLAALGRRANELAAVMPSSTESAPFMVAPFGYVHRSANRMACRTAGASSAGCAGTRSGHGLPGRWRRRLTHRKRWTQFETPVAARLCYPPSSRNRPLSWEKSYGLGTK